MRKAAASGESGDREDRTLLLGSKGKTVYGEGPRKHMDSSLCPPTCTSLTGKSAAKVFKLYDSEGLFLLATPSGGKLWRMRFKFDGKDKLLTLGAYPKVGLAVARKKRNAAVEDRALLLELR